MLIGPNFYVHAVNGKKKTGAEKKIPVDDNKHVWGSALTA